MDSAPSASYDSCRIRKSKLKTETLSKRVNVELLSDVNKRALLGVNVLRYGGRLTYFTLTFDKSFFKVARRRSVTERRNKQINDYRSLPLALLILCIFHHLDSLPLLLPTHWFNPPSVTTCPLQASAYRDGHGSSA